MDDIGADIAIKFFVFTNCANAVAAETRGGISPAMCRGIDYQVFYAYENQSIGDLLRRIELSDFATILAYGRYEAAWLCGSMTRRFVGQLLKERDVTAGEVFFFGDSCHSKHNFIWIQDMDSIQHQFELDIPNEIKKSGEAGADGGSPFSRDPR